MTPAARSPSWECRWTISPPRCGTNRPGWTVFALAVPFQLRFAGLRELRATVERLRDSIPGLLRRVEWVNLGGGYLFEEDGEPCLNFNELCRAVDSLRAEFDVQVFIEPGSGLIRAAGVLRRLGA